MGYLKLFVFARAMDFIIEYVDKNWDTMVAKGKVYVLDWLTLIKLKLSGVELPQSSSLSHDSDLEQFTTEFSSVISSAEEASPPDEG